MAGKNSGSRNGSKGSPRYSERYGADRPNPYTGYLPPGAAPAGQLYHPESLDMKKVGQMMAQSAGSLAAAASERAIEETETKKQMENETARDNTQAQPSPAQQSEAPRDYSPARKKKRGGKKNSGSRSISDEQRQHLQSIQEGAAAEMITEVLSEAITVAAETVAKAPEKEAPAPAAAPSAAPTAAETPAPEKKSEPENDWFDTAQVQENPFDEQYLTQEDAQAASFVPPLEIFGVGEQPESSDEQPEAAAPVKAEEPVETDEAPAATEAEPDEGSDEVPQAEAIEAEAEENDTESAPESAAETAGEPAETEQATEAAEQTEESDEQPEDAQEQSEEEPADEAEVSEEPTEGEDEAEPDEEDEKADDSAPDEDENPDISPEDEETEESEKSDDEPEAGDGVINGVDWETPDDKPEESSGDDDMIIVSGRTGQELAESEGYEHSVLRVADRVTEDEEDEDEEEDGEDDLLFIKKERAVGSTTVFNLPEGVRLPTYIDDDEFLEQWLNEGEDDMAIKDKKLRRRVSTIIGTVTMLFAMVGFVWVIQYAFGALAGIGNTDETKDKYVDFITPVVMSEVQPFESWSGIPTEKLMQSAIFHVLLNMQEAQYQTDDTNKLVIPSGDVADAIAVLYGSAATLSADSLNSLDGDDVYYSDTDDCFHVAATGISGPQPEIVSISKKGAEITLLVGYLDETGFATSEGGYYQSMQFILHESGDNMYITAVRAVAETK